MGRWARPPALSAGQPGTVEEAYDLEGKKGSAVLVGEGDAGPGQTRTVKVKGSLEPGSYAMLCPLAEGDQPHYKLGQLQEFDIG